MREEIKACATWIIGFVVVIWAVEAINLLLDHRLNTLGILPRTWFGLGGIPLSPFLHAGVSHVLFNTAPFVVLAGLVALQGRRVLLRVSLIIVLLGGFGTWLLGRPSYHIGASGLIFGYFGALLARGWYERSLLSILIALVTISLYGGIIWGLLPTFSHVSWEGHLFGFLAGVFAARSTSNASR